LRADITQEAVANHLQCSALRVAFWTSAKWRSMTLEDVLGPGAHLVLYHGVLAGRHAWRSEVVPEPTQMVSQEDESALTPSGVPASSHYKTWAALLYRVFGVLPSSCSEHLPGLGDRSHQPVVLQRVQQLVERHRRRLQRRLLFLQDADYCSRCQVEKVQDELVW